MSACFILYRRKKYRRYFSAKNIAALSTLILYLQGILQAKTFCIYKFKCYILYFMTLNAVIAHFFKFYNHIVKNSRRITDSCAKRGRAPCLGFQNTGGDKFICCFRRVTGNSVHKEQYGWNPTLTALALCGNPARHIRYVHGITQSVWYNEIRKHIPVQHRYPQANAPGAFSEKCSLEYGTLILKP